MKSKFLFILFLLFLVLNTASLYTQNQLIVGLGGSTPFLIYQKNQSTGIIVDLWKKTEVDLMKELKIINIKKVHYNHIQTLLSDLEKQKIDLACGSISVTTERYQKFDFSYPFYETQLGIISPKNRFSIKNFFTIFNKNVLLIPFIFLLLLFLIGFAIWKIESRENPDIPEDPIKGIASGTWLAIVTFTTVGYGDLSPKTTRGRILFSFWMILAMVFASSLTASITSALTLFQLSHPEIESVDDLYNKKIIIIQNSSSEEFVKKYSSRLFYVKDIQSAFQLLRKESLQYDAFVYDYPILKYMIETQKYKELELIPVPNFSQFYACAVKKNQHQNIIKTLNKILLKLKEKNELNRLFTQWKIL